MDPSSQKFRFKLWLFLSFCGLAGVASLLLSKIPMAELPSEVKVLYSPFAIRLLMLVNPALLVLIFTAVGTALYRKVGFSAPLSERLLYKTSLPAEPVAPILKTGVALGIISGALIVITAGVFEPMLPAVLTQKTNDFDMHIATRLLYGGITEELLLRFGVMTLLVWLIAKITRKLSPAVYWISIFVATLLFALGHLPAVFNAVPHPSAAVYAYVLLANGLGGLLFGYAYWKRGLECACIAHAVLHLVIVSAAWVNGW